MITQEKRATKQTVATSAADGNLRHRAFRRLTAVVASTPIILKVWLKVSRFDRRVSVAYISLDEPDMLITAHEYYMRLGVTISVFLDDRSSPSTVTQLEAVGLTPTLVTNTRPYVEGLYREVATNTQTEWLWIMTNDELLNVSALLEASLRTLRKNVPDCIATARRWVARQRSELAVGLSDVIGPDYQYRLIRHSNLHFTAELHTAGFVLPTRVSYMTLPSCIYHFDWVIRTLDQREAKLAFYETHMRGATERYEKWYLPERFPEAYRWEPLADKSVSRSAAHYQQVK